MDSDMKNKIINLKFPIMDTDLLTIWNMLDTLKEQGLISDKLRYSMDLYNDIVDCNCLHFWHKYLFDYLDELAPDGYVLWYGDVGWYYNKIKT